ncbi:hypothetical protein Nmel_003935 [Mimus melanotis]
MLLNLKGGKTFKSDFFNTRENFWWISNIFIFTSLRHTVTSVMNFGPKKEGRKEYSLSRSVYVPEVHWIVGVL